jgi:hypothetical protein
MDVGDDRHARGAGVARTSSVGVLVIVCTLIGASPPTGTEPTMIWRDWRRAIVRHGRIEEPIVFMARRYTPPLMKGQ